MYRGLRVGRPWMCTWARFADVFLQVGYLLRMRSHTRSGVFAEYLEFDALDLQISRLHKQSSSPLSH